MMQNQGAAGPSCVLEGPLDPCSIIIFGGTGDLATRKLIPALFKLYANQALPEDFLIAGCGRTRLDDTKYKKKAEEALAGLHKGDSGKISDFLALIHYHSVDFDEPASFDSLADWLSDLEEKKGLSGNRLLYFALPPALYARAARLTGSSRLCRPKKDGWIRLVVEKPFGRDLDSARELDEVLHQFFKEDQIFRIDHYLAKETVQNILIFRFANSIFEPLWNRRYVDYIDITAAESIGIGNRGSYYEEAGVLRDMFQNHMMQLLALIAMEPPASFETSMVRREKIKVFQALRHIPLERIKDFLKLGQYGPGLIDGSPVPGYRQESGVKPDSRVPTYASMELYLDNWRWQGVPFYVTSGKRMPQKMTRISIQFKEVPHSMFRNVLGEHIMANRLVIDIAPEEKISLTFQAKVPGPRICLYSVTMDFAYEGPGKAMLLDAYEKVLIDCMQGDQMLFWHQEGVERCWAFLTPILQRIEDPSSPCSLEIYKAGTWGPGFSRHGKASSQHS